MISIAAWSLTVADPQPNKAHLDMSQPKTESKPIPGFINHVRVHAAHDREHGYYNSFTLYRGCTHSP
jgi:hypothetical protein